jgi:exopolyphosphatase/pppGpp-phosphohydrolase
VLGSLATTERFFKHEPPTPHELESAIDAVEDEVMRVRGMIPLGSALVAAGAALQVFGRAAGVIEAEEAATIEAVERLFQRLASASLGDPMVRRGLLAGNRFVATALILREFMHHLGFASVTFPERAG